MSGVYWCCCEVSEPPQPCDCACTCQYAWWFQDYEIIGYPEAYKGNLLTEDRIIAETKAQSWTLLMWVNGCEPGHGETDYLWHSYEENQPPPNLTSYVRLGVVTPPDQTTRYELVLRIESEQDDWQSFPLNLIFASGTQPGDCRMITIRYEQIRHDGKDVPHVTFRIDYIRGNEAQFEESDRIFVPDRPENGDDWGLRLPDQPKTWVGAYVPRCDDYYDEDFQPWDGCMSNLTIYKDFLNELELAEKWNAGEGILDSNAWERWCPTFDFCWADQIGAIRNITLYSFCPIRDENGDFIEDQNRCIFGRP